MRCVCVHPSISMFGMMLIYFQFVSLPLLHIVDFVDHHAVKGSDGFIINILFSDSSITCCHVVFMTECGDL